MTDATRRGFFRLLAGAAIAPVIAKANIFSDALTLWGDGLHDDTKALQALIDGKVVEFADATMAQGAGWFDKTLILPKGAYKITETVVFNKDYADWGGVVINGQGCHIIVEGDLEYALRWNEGKNCCLFNMQLSKKNGWGMHND